MIDTLYLSHQYFNWKEFVFPRNTSFLSKKNIRKVIDDSTELGDFFTSLEDTGLRIQDLRELVDACNQIILVDISSDDFFNKLSPDSIPIYMFFLNLASQESKYHDITTFDDFLENYFQTYQNQRNTKDPVLWVAGCSISAGSSVPQNKNYANLLSHRLDLPLISLAKEGTGIEWQADQILRADIQKDDLVIWGLTNVMRVEIFPEGQQEHVTINRYHALDVKYQYWRNDYFESPTQAQSAIRKILQVENFLEKIGARYYFFNMLDLAYLPFVFRNHPKFLDLTLKRFDQQGHVRWIDFGDDGAHPGIQQHLIFSEKIFDFIYKNESVN